MKSNSVDLRGLRLRMGWTSSDLARRLGVTFTEVMNWEKNNVIPEERHVHIEFLLRQADLCCDELHTAPVVESYLDQTNCDQIHVDRVKDSILN